jgi:hypothetical protein
VNEIDHNNDAAARAADYGGYDMRLFTPGVAGFSFSFALSILRMFVFVAPAVSFTAWYTTMFNNAHDYSSVFFSSK